MSSGIAVTPPVSVSAKTTPSHPATKKSEVSFVQVLGSKTSSQQTPANESEATETPEASKEAIKTPVVTESAYGALKAENQTELEKLLSKLEGLSEELLEVVKAFLEKSGLQTTENDSKDQQSLEQLTTLLEQQPELMNMLVAFLGQLEQTSVLNAESMPLNAETSAKLLAIFDQVKGLLQQVANQDNVPKETQGKLLKLLEQWTAIEKQAGQSGQSLLTNENGQAASKEQTVWSKLLDAYQKREAMQGQQKYQHSAQVTSSDVGKWAKQLMTATTSTGVEATNIQTPVGATLSTMPMSAVEQYTIHVSQGNTEQPAENKLLNEIQKILQSSKFLTNNGNSQLFLKLRPEHLGDMMIKMTQLNGEMTVKIIVQSQAAKDMLESNMQQLKHMFSPQQVVVEKQDGTLLNQQSNEEPRQSLQKDRQSSEEQQSSFSTDDRTKDDEESETSFYDILMNEKV
ncbi:flagellar hook-length control protein FliK [Radiobacillus kanasensis]|uniref:flagellar hook-length control protein FliK n=1 Tax=Radiobacillus kanasensis TaxID=2844358 RepID=UPI001E36E29C|nr:flagellar hook-length control protein FliK [Radiobacillus kanasensis]UFU01027.1 flagellar hook-length control protein FliK [Radiobacillus kanasensis]